MKTVSIAAIVAILATATIGYAADRSRTGEPFLLIQKAGDVSCGTRIVVIEISPGPAFDVKVDCK